MYATVADIQSYVPQAVAELWDGTGANAVASLLRASRKIDERLGGLDRFAASEIPVPVESDSKYPEILIKLNTYEAVWDRVQGVYAGEAFSESWAWLPANIKSMWLDIERGVYRFGTTPSSASAGSPAFQLGRSSP
jgi:hypothetical protein